MDDIILPEESSVMGNKYEEKWLSTLHVTKFHFLDPSDDEIDIRDIAHALAFTCRYGGHIPVYYSVAEHCIRGLPYISDADKLPWLLHDAEEAYIPDIPRPIKECSPEIKWLGEDLRKKILKRFKAEKANWKKIRMVDDAMLMTEAKIFGFDISDWELCDVGTLDAVTKETVGWDPTTAENLFLKFFNQYRRD